MEDYKDEKHDIKNNQTIKPIFYFTNALNQLKMIIK
jgi:hypothetical protein